MLTSWNHVNISHKLEDQLIRQNKHSLNQSYIMKLNTSLLLFIIACLSSITSIQGQGKCEETAYPPDDQYAVPQYVVDLDLPPLQRWSALMREKGPKLVALVDDVKDLFKSLVGEKIFEIIFKNLAKVATTLPYPFYEELVGISTFSEVPLSLITMYNIFYEAFTLCTSIISQDPSGQLFHGRNLDTGVFLGWDKKNHTWKVAEQLRPLAVELEWRKNGTAVFRSLSFAGYVGILTGVKKDKFTLSINKRFALNGGFVGLLEWILFNDYNQSWVSFLSREIMEEVENYEEAQTRLIKTRLLAPVYFILGGTQPGQGCIITRDRDNSNLLTLGSTKTGSGSWYLVQTNYDHWKKPPFFDDRRTPANRCMTEGGPNNASLGLIYNVLSTKPVLNKETVYTALMQASSGQVHGWIRQCPDPCWPW
ncbi:acid ceramidase-like isoform X2 [Homarus americanus]|uniref:acid ceramidase-like isoform X2 n=1 Tax=Homarus americanus TaxID=6706 RepID=UPI001C465CF9|nr:acid ceramidase-like isoform X2 [Homarus americanus]